MQVLEPVEATSVSYLGTASPDKVRVSIRHSPPLAQPQRRPLNDPDSRPHFTSHVRDCGPADSDHAAAAQSGGGDIPDSQRPDRSRAAEMAALVTLKRGWRLARNRPNVV